MTARRGISKEVDLTGLSWSKMGEAKKKVNELVAFRVDSMQMQVRLGFPLVLSSRLEAWVVPLVQWAGVERIDGLQFARSSRHPFPVGGQE
jgi:hypothetical protein